MAEADAYLLDTGILILYARGRQAAQEMERRFQFAAAPFKPVVSIVTIGEIHAFACRNSWGQGNLARLDRLVSNLVVLDISHREIIAAYASTSAACMRNGWCLGNNDLWIAATAKTTGAVLLTTDRDFDPLVGTILNRILIDPRTGTTI